MAAVECLQFVICLGGCVGDVDICGCKVVGWGFGVGAKVEVGEIRVFDDGVNDVVIVAGRVGFDESFTDAFGYVNGVLGVS